MRIRTLGECTVESLIADLALLMGFSPVWWKTCFFYKFNKFEKGGVRITIKGEALAYDEKLLSVSSKITSETTLNLVLSNLLESPIFTDYMRADSEWYSEVFGKC